ncbi:MAG: hypothetical protein KatS3mg102_2622 [Planctomycetota bacterium]|nr:MAG: hypothetical protein KatS3mg102_2622 [Planctomycetota bacterium]
MRRARRLVAAALLASAGLGLLAPGATRAEENRGATPGSERCLYCEALRLLTAATRCEGCSGRGAPCASCARLAATVAWTAGCQLCAEQQQQQLDTCRACNRLADQLRQAPCLFCAGRELVASRAACSTKCAAARARPRCASCADVRAAVRALRCRRCSQP